METEMALVTRSTGPSFFAGLRNMRDVLADPLGTMMRGVAEHGDTYLLHVPFVRYFVVASAEGAKHVLVDNHRNYTKSANYRGLKVILGDGLVTAEGEKWRHQRRLVQPGFHRERLSHFADTMATCTSDLLDRWDGEPAPVDIHTEMMRLTFRIVGRTLLSAEVDGDAKAFGAALTTAIHWACDYARQPIRLPPWFPTPANVRSRRAQRTIRDLLMGILAARRTAGEKKDDLLDMLMEARDEAGEGMADAQLMHELITLVLAGHETTANALTFALHMLSTHPEVLRRLEREVGDVLDGRTPSLQDLPRLTYTTQVIEEAMRLYPPVWVMEREAIADDVVCGMPVPKGSTIGIPPWAIHRSPRLWPNPEAFDPERFAKGAKEGRPKHAFLPFGGGPRACIGIAFAMMEMQIVLPMIVQRYRLELQAGYRLELDPSITLRPRSGVPMVRRRREAAVTS